MSIPLKERLEVTHVNIDMWQTYLDIEEDYLPNATVCVDSFHVIEHLNRAIDSIRLVSFHAPLLGSALQVAIELVTTTSLGTFTLDI